MSIFDLITSSLIAAYWNEIYESENAYIGEELFDVDQTLDLKISWLVGYGGAPRVLKPSAYDVEAIPRKRIGFDRLSADLPFFKESMYIDEELRQQLNRVLATGIQQYIDMVVNKIFRDEMSLLRGARAQRERMRMQLLTTGYISVEGNGQVYEYDYHVPDAHKKTVTKSWSDASADIAGDIAAAKKVIRTDSGADLTRAICSSDVFGYIRNNTVIRKTIRPLSDGSNVYISDAEIKTYLKDTFDLEIVVVDDVFIDEDGTTQRFVETDLFVMFPAGKLGTMWFGVTPEQSDLMSSNVANVSIVDTGVAVTTVQKADPVNVETKVTQVCMPDFPAANKVYIITTKAQASG